MDGIFRAWGKILSGTRPLLSIEITRESRLASLAESPTASIAGVLLPPVSRRSLGTGYPLA